MRRLRSEGVPVNESLPCIEDDSEIIRRSTDEVVDRAIALMAVAGKGEKAPAAPLSRFVADFRVHSKLTPAERAFMDAGEPSERDFVQFSWRYEALRVLLWALNLLPTLPRPDGEGDPGVLGQIMLGGTEAELRQRARLRSPSELLDFADLTYRYHWAVRDAQLRREDPPAGLHPCVVLEWDYAARWLVGYCDQDWDHISCDT